MIKNLTITETNLVNGLQANSHEAFALLYENYAPALLGIIFKIVQEREEKQSKSYEDMHQEHCVCCTALSGTVLICTAQFFVRCAVSWRPLE